MILRFMTEREKHCAKIATHHDASFMSLDFIPYLSFVEFITVAILYVLVLLAKFGLPFQTINPMKIVKVTTVILKPTKCFHIVGVFVNDF